MHPVIEQMIYYGIVFIMSWFVVGLFLKGFFLAYFKVRLSFGRKLLVRVRALPQDYFRVAQIDYGFLIYKDKDKKERRYKVKHDEIYRFLGVSVVDVDSETGGIMTYDFSAVEGYDAEKFSDLYTRALYRPSLDNEEQQRKIMLIISIVTVIAVIAVGIMVYAVMKQADNIAAIVGQAAKVT